MGKKIKKIRPPKRNPYEYQCTQCGNPLIKKKYATFQKCFWCGYNNDLQMIFPRGRKERNGKD